jgi:uncharacterized protein (DUF885 family)
VRILKRILKWGGLGLLAIAALAAALLAHTWYFRPLNINWFFNRAMIEYAIRDPELLTQLGFLEGMGIRGHNAHLTDASEEREDWIIGKLKRDLATLRSYDRARLNPANRLSYDILENFLVTVVDGERWRWHDYPLNQMFGVQNGLPSFMLTTHRIDDRKGAEHYISRLSQFDRRLDQALDAVRRREARGVIPPTFVVEKVLDEMRGFIGDPPRENPLFAHLDANLGALAAAGRVTGVERERLLSRAEQVIGDTVYPAYARLIAYYEEMLPKTAGNHGVWSLPDGGDYYNYAIRLITTTGLTADQIHAVGLAEVERIGAEMDAILREEGFTDGALGERMRQLRARPDQLYENSDAGRVQIIADFQAIIDEADASLDAAFDIRPRSSVKVMRVPEFREQGSALAYYQPPSLDGARPGMFFINLRNVGDISRLSMRSLIYHEAIPGHHFQIALAQEMTGMPIFRRILPVTAYAEGWALYTEQLAWELGLLPTPLDNLGRLQYEIWRAVRLVVDTGMHAKRWTREEAIDYMIANTGLGDDEVISEIERYLVLPGQALAYKIGMIRILELRERARQALGDRFDLRAFHNIVLTSGALPLDILDRVIDAWIASFP